MSNEKSCFAIRKSVFCDKTKSAIFDEVTPVDYSKTGFITDNLIETCIESNIGFSFGYTREDGKYEELSLVRRCIDKFIPVSELEPNIVYSKCCSDC